MNTIPAFCRHCGHNRYHDGKFSGWEVIRNRNGVEMRKICPVCVDAAKERLGKTKGRE